MATPQVNHAISPDERRDEQMVLAAWLYHVGDHNQQEVADRLGVSRPTVVRLLQQAVDDGVVEIRVTRPLPETQRAALSLESQLAATSIGRVLVADGEGKSAVAMAASQHLKEILGPSDVVGVGWSTTLALLDGVYPSDPPERVVQLVGSPGLGAMGDGYDIALRLARRWGATVSTMPVPVIVGDASAAAALRADHVVARTMNEFSDVTVAVVGVGTARPDSTMIETGYLTEADLESVRAMGAVGEVLGCYVDADGVRVDTAWRERTLGAGLEHLRAIPNAVAVAAGAPKTESILGVVGTGAVDTLVIDASLAASLEAELDRGAFT